MGEFLREAHVGLNIVIAGAYTLYESIEHLEDAAGVVEDE